MKRLICLFRGHEWLGFTLTLKNDGEIEIKSCMRCKKVAEFELMLINHFKPIDIFGAGMDDAP